MAGIESIIVTGLDQDAEVNAFFAHNDRPTEPSAQQRALNYIVEADNVRQIHEGDEIRVEGEPGADVSINVSEGTSRHMIHHKDTKEVVDGKGGKSTVNTFRDCSQVGVLIENSEISIRGKGNNCHTRLEGCSSGNITVIGSTINIG